jgi:sialidase-1
LVLRRSEAGNNWSDIVVLFSEAKRSMNQPTPIVDRETGSIWLVFCRDNRSVFVSHSEDDGLTWSQSRDITDRVNDPTWKYVAAGSGHGIQLNNGRLLLAAWGDTGRGQVTWPPRWGEVEFTYTMFRDDHGATWQRGRPMYENATEEAMVFEAADHRVFITFRSLHDKFWRGYVWSADGGYSWSRIEFDENLPGPPAHASIIKVPEGGANRGLVLFANPASVMKRTHLTVRMSEDDGRIWAVSKVQYSGSSAYSDLTIENDGGVLCLVEADRYSRLVLARFHLGWWMEKNSPEKD